jgi:predicted acylesterase/phospholipase RssA
MDFHVARFNKKEEEQRLFLKQQKLRKDWIKLTRQLEALKEESKIIEEEYQEELEIEQAQLTAFRYVQQVETIDEKEIAEAIKKAEEASSAYIKRVFENEKAQEVTQCRIYRIENNIAHNKKSYRQRMAETMEGIKMAKNYAQEVFDKAQLAISLGQGQIHPERSRYSIPRTTRVDDY